MFAMMETARLEALHLANDPATGLKAIIAIHNTASARPWGAAVISPIPMTKAPSVTPSASPRA